MSKTQTRPRRDEPAILAEIAAAQAEHHEGADTLPAPAIRAIAERIKAARAELSASITDGANPCPECKNPPHGMVKTPARLERGAMLPPLYEIGCLACPSSAARAYGREAAVKAWNDGERVAAAS